MERDSQATPEMRQSDDAVFEADPVKVPQRLWPWLIVAAAGILLLVGIGSWVLILRNRASKVPQLDQVMTNPSVINTGVDVKKINLPVGQ